MRSVLIYRKCPRLGRDGLVRDQILGQIQYSDTNRTKQSQLVLAGTHWVGKQDQLIPGRMRLQAFHMWSLYLGL